MTNAIDSFKKTIAIEPDYAPAHAGLALAYISASTFVGLMAPSDGIPLGKEEARKAIELDPMLADGHAAMGLAKENYDWDWAGAEEDFKKAVGLNPHSSLILDNYATLFLPQGQSKKAADILIEALKFDPRSAALHSDLSWAYLVSGQFELAIRHSLRALELDPNFSQAYVNLGVSYYCSGETDKALKTLEANVALAPDAPWAQAVLGHAYGLTGHHKEAMQVLANLNRLAGKHYVPRCARAYIYLGLGQKEAALGLLEEACAEHEGLLFTLKVDPWYAPLRNEPRFQALLKKVGLDK